MKIELLDLIVSTPGLIVAWFLLMFLIGGILQMIKKDVDLDKDSRLVIWMFLVFFSAFILFYLYPMYHNLRNNGSLATWQTLSLAFDAALGYAILFSFEFFIFVGVPAIIFGGLFAKYAEKAEKSKELVDPIKAMAVTILTMLFPLILIGILLLSEYRSGCQVTVTVTHFFQTYLFGFTEAPLGGKGDIFSYVSSCKDNFKPIDTVVPSSTSISLSAAYNHLESVFLAYNFSKFMAKIFSVISAWIGTIADILSIYGFFEGRSKKKDKTEDKQSNVR